MKIFAENERIKVMFTEELDIPYVVEAENHKDNSPYITKWTAAQHLSAMSNPDTYHLIVKDAAGSYVGYMIIQGITDRNNSVELMRIVITEKGRGYGNAVLTMVKKWCFEVYKAHRLWLDVREHNLRAQHVYQTQGFTREGMLRECVKVGDGYESLVLMSILAHEYTG